MTAVGGRTVAGFHHRARTYGVAALVGLGLMAGCSSSSPPSGGSSAGSPVKGGLTVFAAASLKETFPAIGTKFEQAHPGTKVTFNFGGSSELSTSIDGGAPADVFAAASTKTMATVVAAGNASRPVDFATNTMEVATPPDNPGHVSALADLARPGVTVAVCQAKVPCGAAATALFAKAGITVKPVTLEPDVSSTLQKIRSGEVDAGIVYVTDVKAAGSTVHGIAIPTAANVVTTYPIVALKHARNPSTASAFADFVRSPAGQQVLGAAGFGPP
ncbi:MAG: molybdate ABC transporter substrate-binding protein [bacterium]